MSQHHSSGTTGGEDRHAGACLCGAVRFEVSGNLERFYLCHCARCRKDSGSSHAANLFSSTARLKWITGEDQVRGFVLPGTRHARCFCAVCGSPLPNVVGPTVVVPAGSLDVDVGRRPDAHIFVASRANWDRCLEELPSFDGLP